MINKDFNHPAYINIPYFVIKETRLDLFNKLLFSFFWSFSVSGKKVIASNQYLSSLFEVSERYIQTRIKMLEDMNFIKRKTLKYRRVIEINHFVLTPIDTEDSTTIELGRSTDHPSANIELGRSVDRGGDDLQIVGGRSTDRPYIKDNTKEEIKETTSSSTHVEGELDSFEKFYAAYPRKKGKLQAMKWFKKHKPNSEFVSMLLDDVSKRLSSEWKGKESQFIPYPASYLNGMRWEDAIETSQSFPSREDRADNEVKILAREKAAQISKQREIAHSKGGVSRITRGIDLKALMEKQEWERKKLGMTEIEYHNHLIRHSISSCGDDREAISM